MTKLEKRFLKIERAFFPEAKKGSPIFANLKRLAIVFAAIAERFGNLDFPLKKFECTGGTTVACNEEGRTEVFRIVGCEQLELVQWIQDHVEHDEILIFPGGEIALTLQPEGAFPRQRYCSLVEYRKRGNIWQLFKWQTTYKIMELTPPTSMKRLL